MKLLNLDGSRRDDAIADLGKRPSALRDAHRRALTGMMFMCTGIVLLVFGVIQIFNHNLMLSVFEFCAAAALIVSALRIEKTQRLMLWTYAYLISIFSFLIYIIVMPNASTTAFVWVFIMPVFSYLLLGRMAGFLVAAPFMVVGGIAFFVQLEAINSARVVIDFLNPFFCAVMMLLFVQVYETRRADAENRLVMLAETDALTGLDNRRRFQSTLDRTLSEARRSQASFALVIMDIDHFKRVNDSLGHDAGDRVLQRIAVCLSERLRTTDSVGRLGGEEFGLLLRDVNRASALELVNDLRQRIAGLAMTYDQQVLHITASFGIAYWPADADRASELFQAADRRLYDGKHAGRNTVFDRDDTAQADVAIYSDTPPPA